MILRIATIGLIAAVAACSPDNGNPEIAVDSAWARPTLREGATSAAYLSISNAGNGKDRLVAASSDIAARVTLHRSSRDGGVAKMRPIEGGVALPAGETIHFRPGGNHLMLEGLKRRLANGDRIRLILNFERSAQREVQATVGAALATDAGDGHEGH